MTNSKPSALSTLLITIFALMLSVVLIPVVALRDVVHAAMSANRRRALSVLDSSGRPCRGSGRIR